MDERNKPARTGELADDAARGAEGDTRLLSARWWPYLAPLAVFMLVGSLEPIPPAKPAPSAAGAFGADASNIGAVPAAEEEADDATLFSRITRLTAVDYRWYPLVYLAKIVATLAVMAAAWPMYRSYRWRLNRWAAPLGVIGAVAWIGLCKLRLEGQLLAWAGLDDWLDFGARSAYNPFAELAGHPAWASGFLFVRFCGLVVVVPVIEEFFLRGFLARVIVHPNWWAVPFGQVNGAAIVGLTVFPLLMHPGEILAALVWFSGVTWLMVRTRNIWDCVICHATTNLLLGLYVLASGDWRLM